MNKKNNHNRKNKGASFIRKEFYKKIIIIGLCIIPIVLFADNKGTFRLLPLPFFLYGMYQLMQIVAISKLIIDDFFPPKISYEKNTKPIDKLVYYFSTTLFFISLISLLFEIRNFDNTIQGTKLFWTAGVFGILVAIITTTILKLTNPSVYYESKRRYTVHLGLFIGFFLISTALASFVNHYFANPTTFYKNYKIESKSISGGRSTEYFFYLKMENGNEERFSVGKTRYNDFNEGEEIKLCLLKGKLGFDYVTGFKKIKQ
ncbi:putative membrane protein [Flavobacterium nitrogenifigens]|uniref:Putative membrane protein n=1 Tax=Flavobacterium nitrogenifigens TaxID=1617283 RepID=A0A7W7NAI3_9FLAO|nr:hypothetical protein [Flavobacterium notoginsengisoli]MBB4804586.1 putative membrane protein [Flavobacterium nitrogenifigens]